MRRRTPHNQQQNPYSSRIRKNNNTATAVADSAAHVVTEKQQHGLSQKDWRHNGDVPVCKLLQDAVVDIFPELDTDKRITTATMTTTTNSTTKEDKNSAEVALVSSSTTAVTASAQRDSFGSFLRSKLLRDSEARYRQMRRRFDNVPAANLHNKQKGIGRPEGEAVGATTTTNKKKKKKKKKKNSNKNSSATPTNENDRGDGTTTAAVTAVTATSASEETDNPAAIPGHGEHHEHKDAPVHDETVSLKGCNDDEENESSTNKQTKKNGPATGNATGEQDRKGNSGGNDTGKKDKLEELLDDRSHPMFLLPTDDDNKSVDISIEALDMSVRRRGQILKLAEAKQQQVDFLDMIPNEDDTKNNNSEHPLSNGHITYGNDEELPSCSNVSYSMAADSSIYDERHVDGMSFDDDIDHDTADDFRRLISYFTSPLDVTVLIAPDRQILPIPTDISIDVRSDAVRSSLDVPIMGTSTMGGDDTSLDGGNEKLKIARALLDAYIEDHLLPQEIAANENGELVSNIFSPEDMGSFIDFCNQRSIQKRDQAIGISFHELTDAINSIGCSGCKTSVMTEMNQLKRNIEESIEDANDSTRQSSILDTFVLDPSHLDQGTDEGAPLEEAFAYHQLEEGHHLPKYHRASLFSSTHNGALSDKKLSFVVVPSTNTKSKRAKSGGGENPTNQSHIFFFKPLSSDQIDSFLKDWLPCGVDESALFDDGGSSKHTQSELSTVDGRTQSEFDYYEKKATEMYQTFTTHIEEMEAGRIKLLNEWKSAVAAKSGHPILCQYSFAIRNDEGIKQHAAQVLAVMSSFAEISHEFAALQLDIWTSYLGTLQKICKTTQAFYSRLEELSDQNTGTIIVVGDSKEVPQANFDFMDSIINSLTDLSGTLNSTTKRIMKEWATHLTWQNSHGESGLVQLTKLDASFRALVDSFSKWIAPVRNINMEERAIERSKTVTETVELANGLLPELQDEFDSVRGYFTKEKSDYFHEFLDNADLYCKKWTVLGMNVQHDSIFNMTAGLILIWRQVRIMQSWRTRSVNVPPMPLKLKKWMMEGDADEQFGVSHHKCGMGQRRLACTIAGLSYTWLRQRYDEWKAEKAEKELLIDFDTDALSDSPKQGQKVSSGKASKKKKKKKSKNTTTSTTGTSAATERTEEISGENIGISEDQSGANLESYSDENIDTVESATAEDRMVLVQHGQEKATENEEAAANSELSEGAVNIANESELEILAGFESNVFIYDDDGKVTVEEFLSQRYDQVIESDEKLIIIY